MSGHPLDRAFTRNDEYAAYDRLADALGSLQELFAKQIVGIPDDDRALCCACGQFDPHHESHCPVPRGLAIIEAALTESPKRDV